MWPYIKAFFTDESAFLATMTRFSTLIRAVLAALALAVTSGQIDLGAIGWWSGPVLLAASLLVRGGDKNIPLLNQVQALTPDERAAVKTHLG